MQIKTVCMKASEPQAFDAYVNKMLEDGWKLDERGIRFGTNAIMLYAFLSRSEGTETSWTITKHLVNGKCEYRCSNCGCKVSRFDAPKVCPSCNSKMVKVNER